jgi:hypothetical protein
VCGYFVSKSPYIALDLMYFHSSCQVMRRKARSEHAVFTERIISVRYWCKRTSRQVVSRWSSSSCLRHCRHIEQMRAGRFASRHIQFAWESEGSFSRWLLGLGKSYGDPYSGNVFSLRFPSNIIFLLRSPWRRVRNLRKVWWGWDYWIPQRNI